MTSAPGAYDVPSEDEDDLADDAWEIGVGVVRPYIFTGGRTLGSRPLPAVEAMLESTVLARRRGQGLPPEQRHIVELCERPLSVAEVASHSGMPLGVVRVVVAEMAGARLVEIFEGAVDLAADVELLQRLIARVKAIPA